MAKKVSLIKRAEHIYSMTVPGNKQRIQWPTKYAVQEIDGGERLLLSVDENDVVHHLKVGWRKIAVDITAMATVCKHISVDSPAEIDSVAKYIMNRIEPLKEAPKILLDKNTPGLCWHRVPFELEPQKECPPTWKEMIDRTTNADALCQWIGQLFFPDSPKSNYVWIYGDGQNGKGTMVRMLQKVLGPTYASEEVPDRGSRRFWTSNLVGKRLVVFPDCSCTLFPSGGFFRALTGDDHVRIEVKHGPTYSLALAAKFMFLSNEAPALEDVKADLRRAIICHIGRVTNFFENYEQLLWSEIEQFIGYCYNRALFGNPVTTIDVDPESFAQVTMIKSGELEMIMERHFYYVYDDKKLERDQIYLRPQEFHLVCNNIALLNNVAKKSQFLSFLERKYGCKNKPVHLDDGTKERRLVGLKARHWAFEHHRDKPGYLNNISMSPIN